MSELRRFQIRWQKAARSIACALAFAAFATTVRGDFTNGSFETGTLAGFTSVGTATVVTSSIGVTPAAGTFQALLRTGQGRGAPVASLASFLGVTQAALSGINGPVFDGSAVMQTTAIAAGDVVSFSFRFLTTESVSPPDINFLDYAFVVIDGAITKLADLASTFAAAPAATGYTSITTTPSSFSIGGLSVGNHTFAIGVVDVGDFSTVGFGDSGLIVDGLVAGPGTPVIPEPSSVALLAVGVAGLLGWRRRASS